MEQEYNFRELYDVTLKAISEIKVGEHIIAPNETIAAFDKIMLGTFDERQSFYSAKGGFDNRSFVFWERTEAVNIALTQGVFSSTQFAIMNNAKLLSRAENTVLVGKREIVNVVQGHALLSHIPNSLFIYDLETGNKIVDFEYNENDVIVDESYSAILADYEYIYTGVAEEFEIGQSLLNGFVKFSGKTRIKEDVTGNTRTGILTIPNLKLTSSFSIQAGMNSMPNVGMIQGIANPVGNRSNRYVMAIQLLDSDID